MRDISLIIYNDMEKFLHLYILWMYTITYLKTTVIVQEKVICNLLVRIRL